MAYVVPATDNTPRGHVLREFLRQRLPDYMVPAAVVVLDAVPLTPNGKLDRRALPAPEGGKTMEFEAPSTPAEEILAGLWADLLQLEAVGRRDHFFELGGHSLLATRLVARVREFFRLELPIRAVFEHPELAALARAIDGAARGVALPPIEAHPEHTPKLSFAQQRLWFLAQWEGEEAATYNMPLALELSGRLELAALRASLVWLLERHDSMSQCFPAVDGEAQVRLREPDAEALPALYDLAGPGAEDRDREVRRRTDAHAVAPFDLAGGPLFKAELLVLGEDRHVLLLNLHHIAADDWSWGVLLRDWQHAYAAFAAGHTPGLAPLAIRYSDYAAWQRQWLKGEALRAQADYWAAELADCPALLEL
ncbi:MAG: condensation domain-containing protein, partial [Pseudomonadota bacterium]